MNENSVVLVEDVMAVERDDPGGRVRVGMSVGDGVDDANGVDDADDADGVDGMDVTGGVDWVESDAGAGGAEFVNALMEMGPSLVWDRPEPPSRPTPSPLSRERIVAAAVNLADTAGLKAVSLRKVASALDAGPMRLYGYLSTKEELLDLMVDAVYGEMVLGSRTGTDWRTPLRALAHEKRRVVLRHEWFVDLIGSRPTFGPNAMAYLEAGFALLDGAPGFAEIDTVMRAFGVLSAFVVGALRGEITERNAERTTGMSERDWQIANGAYLTRMVATGRFPTLAKVMADATHPDPDTTFDRGLELVLDGIAAGTTTV